MVEQPNVQQDEREQRRMRPAERLQSTSSYRCCSDELLGWVLAVASDKQIGRRAHVHCTAVMNDRPLLPANTVLFCSMDLLCM